ncbi:MAG: hypothetical protein ACM3H8_15450, partial [Sphingobacteriales bacterium]
MKYFFFFGVLLVVFTACQQNNKSTDSKKVYGSANAVVTNQPNSETAINGPLAYGSNIPKIQDADTIDVKFDVKHQLFHVSSAVAYTAWMFGESVPGPVLRIRVGQTVRFSMTDRSNDTMANMAMHMNMTPMPHSID